MTDLAQGVTDTCVPSVKQFWSHCAVGKHIQDYPFGLVFIFQGYKIGYIGERQFNYGAGTYLAIGLPIHFMCETHVVDSEPLLGIFIQLDVAQLSNLSAQMMSAHALSNAPLTEFSRVGVEPLSITTPMQGVLARLIAVLHDPCAGAVLGELYVRELCFHVLRDDNAAVLLSHLNRSTPQSRVAQTLEYLRTHLDIHFSLAELAARSHMSPASFNRHFKVLTGTSVVQYSKTLRLMHARQLLTVEMQNVNQTAEQVGYSSAAQFSRDFKVFFGVPPRLADTL